MTSTIRTALGRWSCALLLLAPGIVRGQSASRDVLTVLDRFYDATRLRDTNAVRALLHPSMRVTTVLARGGGSVAMGLPATDFVSTVARAQGAEWNQRLVKPEVHIDGGLASVWSYYVFHRGKAFDHCGVVAVHLANESGAWKIVQLTDTHRTSDCERLLQPPGGQ